MGLLSAFNGSSMGFVKGVPKPAKAESSVVSKPVSAVGQTISKPILQPLPPPKKPLKPSSNSFLPSTSQY